MADAVIRIVGLNKVLRSMRSLGGVGRDMLAIAAETVREQTLKRFRTKTNPDGGAWKSSPNGLQDTGRLMGSIRHIVSGSSAAIGSPLVYAPVHQFGATIRPRRASRLVFQGLNGAIVAVKRVTIPARPYLGVSERDAREVEQRMSRALGALLA